MDETVTADAASFSATLYPYFSSTSDFSPENCSYEKPGYIACQAGLALHFYILPVILAAGFFGNTCSFVIMMNSDNRKTVCCLLFAAMAISDNLVLLSITIRIVKEFSHSITDVCPIYGFLISFGCSCTSSLLTVIAYQRYEAVCKVFARESKITRKNAGWMILLLVTVGTIIHIPAIFTSKIRDYTVCSTYSSHGAISIIWLVMTNFLFWCIPVALITHWNLKIMQELRQHTSELRKCSSYSLTDSSSVIADGRYDVSVGPRRRHANRKLTTMLILVSVANICLTLPTLVRLLYFLCVKPTDASSKAMRFLAYHITNKLFMTNHAINFYLYCLSGSKFRNDFIALVKVPFKLLGFE